MCVLANWWYGGLCWGRVTAVAGDPGGLEPGLWAGSATPWGFSIVLAVGILWLREHRGFSPF